MRVLVSFPGRAGDLLWALPTVRAISETFGVPVTLRIAGEFESLIPLLRLQPYLAEIQADPAWSLSAGWEPATTCYGYDQVFHLGYRRWPELPLPFETLSNYDGPKLQETPDLLRPWITVPPKKGLARAVCCGWSDCWFELKVGLVDLAKRRTRQGYDTADLWHLCLPPHSRWATETDGYEKKGDDWLQAAQWIANGQVFFGDCSALHVLAVALGKPVVLCEPMEARWNPIFYPLGKTGPRVTLVTGLDGLPTFDARHCAEALEKALAGVSR